jgi:hypothetical protein
MPGLLGALPKKKPGRNGRVFGIGNLSGVEIIFLYGGIEPIKHRDERDINHRLSSYCDG